MCAEQKQALVRRGITFTRCAVLWFHQPARTRRAAVSVRERGCEKCLSSEDFTQVKTQESGPWTEHPDSLANEVKSGGWAGLVSIIVHRRAGSPCSCRRCGSRSAAHPLSLFSVSEPKSLGAVLVCSFAKSVYSCHCTVNCIFQLLLPISFSKILSRVRVNQLRNASALIQQNLSNCPSTNCLRATTTMYQDCSWAALMHLVADYWIY